MADISHSGHDHAHNLVDKPKSRLFIVFWITFTFMIVEAIVGYLSNSLALLADAGHMLNDVVSIMLAIIAIHLSSKTKTKDSLTYGYKRVEVLSGLVNGISLILIAFLIIKEAIQRMFSPDVIEIKGAMMLTVAFLGLLANIVGVLILKDKKDDSINVDGAYQHIIADLLGSVAAIIAGLGIILFQANWLDIVASIVVSLMVFKSGVKITMKAVNILIEAIPDGTDIIQLRDDLLDIEGINGIYDLHAWTLTDGMDIVTAHLNIENETMHKSVRDASTRVAKEHGFHHITFQIECEPCVDLKGKCNGI